MGIVLENNQNMICLSDDFMDYIISVAQKILKIERVDVDYEVFISMVDNCSIRKINFKYRGIDSDTDCLSFPILDYCEGKVFKEQYSNFQFPEHYLEDGKLILGDIIISLEKAKSQSIEFNHSFKREVIYLVIHSLLHLLGYDHVDDKDRFTMREAEKNIIREIGIYRSS